MKKRFLKWISVSLLICMLGMTLAACAETTPPVTEPDTNKNPPQGEPEKDPEKDPEQEEEAELSYDLTRYRIVYPFVSDTTTSAAVSLLKQELTEKGLQLNVEKDAYLGESNEKAYEILVGATNRAETEEAMEILGEEAGYVIQFFENRIVLNANHTDALEKAVRYFVDHYVFEDKDYVVDAETGEWYAAARRQLSGSGSFNYPLVVSDASSNSLKSAAKNLQSKLQSMTGVTVPMANDASYDKKTHNIVIGTTAYPESLGVRNTLQINRGGIFLKENKIVVNGHHEQTVLLALQEFMELLDREATVSAGGALTVYVPLRGSYAYSNWLGDMPEFSRGTYDGVYECGEDVIQVRYSDVTASYLDDYVKETCAYGYKVTEDNTIGENRAITLLGEKGLVHLTYLKYDNSVKIVTDPLIKTSYKTEEPAYTKVTENTLAVSTLLYTHREVQDGNGMGYVVTLEDGRYIIFDGGYIDQKTGESQADVLFDFLDKNYKRNERKIVIAAWVFSHSHGDHYGAFRSFSDKYANMVEIQNFIYNAPSLNMYSSFDGFLSNTLPKTYLSKYPNAKILKPHTGQILKFCNVEFEVLYTHEDFAPGKISLLNDASMVLRMKVNGQSVLFTGDAEASSSGLLCQMYGNHLKSDILQINHHGYSGGTVELYDYVDPTYTMWPTSQDAFDLRTTGNKYQWVSAQAVISNKHIYDKVGKSNCFVADGPVEIIHFPLKDKLLDITYYTPK